MQISKDIDDLHVIKKAPENKLDSPKVSAILLRSEMSEKLRGSKMAHEFTFSSFCSSFGQRCIF